MHILKAKEKGRKMRKKKEVFVIFSRQGTQNIYCIILAEETLSRNSGRGETPTKKIRARGRQINISSDHRILSYYPRLVISSVEDFFCIKECLRAFHGGIVCGEFFVGVERMNYTR